MDKKTVSNREGDQSSTPSTPQGQEPGPGKSSFLDWIKFTGNAETSGSLRTHLSELDGRTLADKLRRSYTWILNNAIITPFYDIAYGSDQGTRLTFPNGDSMQLPHGAAFSSYILLPLLTFATRRKCLLVGGPGRGKTAIAVLLGICAGYSPAQVRRAVQHGQPQLTVSDLLGTPLPADLLRAEEIEQVKVSWREWLKLRVKIIDEYNRIPTKTQSALLSLLAEGYAEQLGQTIEVGDAAWFLTANDDAGGGTFAVIEALKDRIDVTVRAMTFNPWFLKNLLERIEKHQDPAQTVPSEIIFTEAELETMYREILSIEVPPSVLHRIELFLGSFDFCQRASPVFEYKSKDTLKLTGTRLGQVCTDDCPLDKRRHICAQVESGVSVRSYMTLLAFAKGLAYFRGQPTVELEDIRQLAPFVLHDKLVPNKQSPFFTGERQALLRDKIAWIRVMFDLAMEQYDNLRGSDGDKGVRNQVEQALAEVDAGLDGIDAATVRKRMQALLAAMQGYQKGGELSATVYADLIVLKSIYLRNQSYLDWLAKGGGAKRSDHV